MAAKRPLRRRARNPWVRRFKRTAVVLGYTFGIALAAGLAVYIPIYREASDDAVNIEKKLVVQNANPTVIVASDNKTILYSAAAIRRKVVDLTDKQYPPYLRLALVAAEDRRFFDHQGVDPIGLARAVYRRGAAGGGSTIPMQLAKLMINGDARTPLRKLKDIATAQQIESLKTKDEILNLYANYVYYGEQAYGIERAAEIYFGKSAKDLTLGESAMLARSVRLPSRVNPRRKKEKMFPERDYVLDVMRQEDWITQDQYDKAIRETLHLNPHPTYSQAVIKSSAGYFVRHVLSQLKRDPDLAGIDFDAGGYRIETTLNYALQQKALDAVDRVLDENRGHKVNDGAIVVMNGRGQILCEVGGPDYKRRQFNVITMGTGRQPGSAFKSIVYATAMKNGLIHPGSWISNEPIHIKDGNKVWSPQNASRKENASGYTLETAFALSVNRPAIHTILDVGPKNVVGVAKDVFGIDSPLGPYGSLALGSSDVKPIEMLEAYSVFMLGGDRVEPQPITRVIGPDGKVVKVYEPEVHPHVLDAKVARDMDEVLKTPVAYGTATYAQAVPNARGKTGTTNAAKDAWFCGYSDGLVGVGWVGNSSKKGEALPMSSSVFGGTVTVKIWTSVMLAAHNLHLTGGPAAPGTTVSVAATPDEPEVQPVRSVPEEPRRETPTTAPPADPIIVDPAPVTGDDSVPDPASTPVVPDPTTEPEPTPEPDPTPVDPPRRREPRRSEPRRSEPRRSDPAPKAEPETETAEICVDTGLRAGAYCPETVTRTFPKGRAPRAICKLHHG